MNTVPKAHLLFISYYFPPMGGGGVQRILKFLKYWDYQHFDVSVLTVKPSYFYSEDPSLLEDLPENPAVYQSGTLDPFRLIFLVRKILGLSSAGKRGKFRESNSILRTVANLLFLPDSRILWLPLAIRKVYHIHKGHPIDLIIATMPPFTSGVIAHRAFLKLGISYLLDFRDAWTRNPYYPPLSRFHERLQGWLEERVLRNAKGVVFVNPGLHKYYRERYDRLTDKNSTVIRNGYDPDDFIPVSTPPVGESSVFQIGVMGTVYSHGNAPLHLLNALNLLEEQNPDLMGKIRPVFIGKWTVDFIRRVESYHLSNPPQFINYLPHREALTSTARLQALALAIHTDKKGSENVTPGRIYEYLYLRKPVLAMCHERSDLAEIVRMCHAGESVDYADILSIAAVLEKWVRSREQLSSMYTFDNIEEFHRGKLTHRMIRFVEDILKG